MIHSLCTCPLLLQFSYSKNETVGTIGKKRWILSKAYYNNSNTETHKVIWPIKVWFKSCQLDYDLDKTLRQIYLIWKNL